MRAKTTAIGDYRINWFEVTHVKIKKDENSDRYEFRIYRKYKASIKEVVIESQLKDFHLHQYFKRYMFAPLTNELFINLNRIIYVHEEFRPGNVDKTAVEIVLADGFEVREILETTRWTWWKNNFLG